MAGEGDWQGQYCRPWAKADITVDASGTSTWQGLESEAELNRLPPILEETAFEPKPDSKSKRDSRGN